MQPVQAAQPRWSGFAHGCVIGGDGAAPRSRLTDTYLCGYTSIHSQQVIDPKMPNAHDVLFRTLADPTRRALFERLCRDGEQTVGALTARAGVSQPAVSKHLGVLKEAGLVRDRHEGRQTHYSAQRGALAPLIDWTSQMAGFWQSRFDRLEDLLKRMDQ
jgi:DNA-binding transcriptional ArsR family regulator